MSKEGTVLQKVVNQERTICREVIQEDRQGFPGGAVVESLPVSGGDTGSGPGLGGSHMPRSGWAHEPQLLSLCSAAGEAAAVGGPCTAMKGGSRSWGGPSRRDGDPARP